MTLNAKMCSTAYLSCGFVYSRRGIQTALRFSFNWNSGNSFAFKPFAALRKVKRHQVLTLKDLADILCIIDMNRHWSCG
jgi:hypothetical protein